MPSAPPPAQRKCIGARRNEGQIAQRKPNTGGDLPYREPAAVTPKYARAAMARPVRKLRAGARRR